MCFQRGFFVCTVFVADDLWSVTNTQINSPLSYCGKTVCLHMKTPKIIPLNSLQRHHTPDKGVTVDVSRFQSYESEYFPPGSCADCVGLLPARAGQREFYSGGCAYQVIHPSTRPLSDLLHPTDTVLEIVIHTVCSGL